MQADLAPIDDRNIWTALARRTGPGQVQQSWAYGAALRAAGNAVHRLRLIEAGVDIGMVQLVGRRLLGGPVVLWHGLGGPAWLTDDPARGVAALRLLKRRYGWRRGSLLLLTPASDEPAQDRGRLERAGFRQAMTGYTTARLDLGAELAVLRAGLHHDWRRRLRQGPSAGLRLQWRDPRADPLALDALLAADAVTACRRGYRSLPPAVVAATARRGGGLLATAAIGDVTVAGMLFLQHGTGALYQTGWSDDEGRRRFAHHHLLWGAVERLRADGIRALDLGGLDLPSGVVRFKLASGAVPTTFAGTFA